MVISVPEAARLAERFEDRPAEEALAWAITRFSPRIALACSFQDEDMVVLDMAWRIRPDMAMIAVDTGRLHRETHDMMDRVRARYGVAPEILKPDADEVQAMTAAKGADLFYDSVENRQACCNVRKVRPLRRRLASLDAWVTGLRRGQCESRAGIRKIEADAAHHGIVKLNPLADWTRAQVDEYIRARDVLRHPLYAQGYASIGCQPCTRPVQAGEDARAGRWWWEDPARQKECGIHGGEVKE